VRKDGGDAGANVVAADDRGVADVDAGNIGDGVERTTGEDADLQSEIGGTGTGVLGSGGGEQERQDGKRTSRHGEEYSGGVRSSVIGFLD